MAIPALVTTPGAANANSYCTLAEANTYHETRLHTSDWDAAADDTKNKALLWAARLLDEQIEWCGYPTDPQGQAMMWPRVSVYDSRYGLLYDRLWRLVESDEVPQEVKDAQAELAAYLISGDKTVDATKGISDVKLGSIGVSFSASTPVPRKVIPDVVYEKIAQWGERRFVNAGTARLVRT